MEHKAEMPYLTERGAAERLGVSVAWLRKRRLLKLAPRWAKLGACVRYSIRELDTYAENCTVPAVEAQP